MQPEQLQIAIYSALNTATMRALLSSDSADLMPFDDLELEGDASGYLELEGDTSGNLSLGENIAIYTTASPQIPQSEDPAYFPYLTMSFIGDEGLPDKDLGGSDATVQIDVWHRTASELAIKPIAAAVYTHLQRVELPELSGWIDTECEGMSFDVSADGRTHRALLEFRVTARG